jgi:anaerobic dimethyl sulfoxide reductase subunit B (iron-sulfur subunit)
VTYAFTFDASACTGCKACQAACKDKNNLPLGVLWRRVYEVSGGEWIFSGSGWNNSIFAYNLSMSCNHCVHPKCAGVCPVNAYHVRDDGIVILDSSICIGCGYCNWACPYAVPQFDRGAGVMTKCNFCFDNIEENRSPACVAACPMRVLNFIEVSGADSNYPGMALWVEPASIHPFPLPEYSRTEPHLLLKPHAAMLNDVKKEVANHEEVRPEKVKSELPLVLFSLLGQMAVGVFWAANWMFIPILFETRSDAFLLHLLPNFIIGLCMALAILLSFTHLGAKRNAWRVLSNIKKSWLSKEILFLSLFCAAWLISLLNSLFPFDLVIALIGVGFIYSMSNVYRLRSMPSWNNWRTPVAFFLSAVLLGQILLVPVVLIEAMLNGITLPMEYTGFLSCIFVALFVGEIGLIYSVKTERSGIIIRLRSALIFSIIACEILFAFVPIAVQFTLAIGLVLLVFAEEALGRWKFYAELNHRIL